MPSTLSATAHYKGTYAEHAGMSWLLNGFGVSMLGRIASSEIPDIFGQARFTFEKGTGTIRKDGQIAAGTSEERSEAAIYFGGQWHPNPQWRLAAAMGYGIGLGTLSVDNRDETLIPYKNCGGLEQVANTTKGLACVFQEISSLHVDQNLFLEAGAAFGNIRADLFFGLTLNEQNYTQVLPSSMLRWGVRVGFDF